MSRESFQRAEARIDLTPLVDVIFLLLIFFMVSTTFKTDEGMELRLPQTKSSDTLEAKETISVQISADGSVSFKGQQMEAADLEQAAKAALATDTEGLVVIEADRGAKHGSVVVVMDALRRAGARGLTVATTSE